MKTFKLTLNYIFEAENAEQAIEKLKNEFDQLAKLGLEIINCKICMDKKGWHEIEQWVSCECQNENTSMAT